MTKQPTAPVVPYCLAPRVGRADAPPDIARWLGLAAAPTFAIMAFWTGFFGDHPGMLCMSMQGSSPLSGMTVMYMLMGAFHLPPWIKLVSGHSGIARAPSRAAFNDPGPPARP